MNTAPFQICQASAEHLVDIQACANSAYAKYVTRMGRKPAPMIADFASQITLGQVFVALSGVSVAGYVVFYRKADHLHLENVAVLPEHAGKGLACIIHEGFASRIRLPKQIVRYREIREFSKGRAVSREL